MICWNQIVWGTPMSALTLLLQKKYCFYFRNSIPGLTRSFRMPHWTRYWKKYLQSEPIYWSTASFLILLTLLICLGRFSFIMSPPSSAHGILSVSSAVLVLAFIFVVLRFFVRKNNKMPWKTDDWILGIALVSLSNSSSPLSTRHVSHEPVASPARYLATQILK